MRILRLYRFTRRAISMPVDHLDHGRSAQVCDRECECLPADRVIPGSLEEAIQKDHQRRAGRRITQHVPSGSGTGYCREYVARLLDCRARGAQRRLKHDLHVPHVNHAVAVNVALGGLRRARGGAKKRPPQL